MSDLRILYVSACLPVANGTGSQKRSYVAVAALRRLGVVDYLEAPPAIDAAEPVRDQSGLFSNRVSAARLLAENPPVWRSFLQPGAFARILRRAWITAGAMLPLDRGQQAATRECLKEVCGNEPYDVIYIFQAHAGLFMANLLPGLSHDGTVTVIDWDAAERPAAMEQYRARESSGVKTRIAAFLNDRKLARYERCLLDIATLTVCASDYDVEYFRVRHPHGAVCAIPNCIDIPAAALAPADVSAPTVLFVGLINYWPNRSGLLRFLERIWPQVRAHHPGACFNIVGRGVTDDIRAWHGRDGINVVGEVGHVAPWYAACHVAVAPMFFSVGSSIKILEALAFNRALVAFEASTRRHKLTDGEHVAVAHDDAGFAACLNALLDDPAAAAAMAARGRLQVIGRYASETVVEASKAAIELVRR